MLFPSFLVEYLLKSIRIYFTLIAIKLNTFTLILKALSVKKGAFPYMLKLNTVLIFVLTLVAINVALININMTNYIYIILA